MANSNILEGMAGQKELGFYKHEELGRLLDIDPVDVRFAHLPKEQGEDMLRRAINSDRRKKYLEWPAIVVAAACFLSVASKKFEDIPASLAVPFTMAALAYGASRRADQRKSMSNSIKKAVSDRVNQWTGNPDQILLWRDDYMI
jgi:hypothetical protein